LEKRISDFGLTYTLGEGRNSDFLFVEMMEMYPMYKKEERGRVLGEYGLRGHHLPIQKT
jgi:hypothetical protein